MKKVRDRLPFAFEDLGEQQVKNITRPVRVYRVRDVNVGAKRSAQPSLILPGKPSIAVLPFANLSGDPEQEYFADGMVDAIGRVSKPWRIPIVIQNQQLRDCFWVGIRVGTMPSDLVRLGQWLAPVNSPATPVAPRYLSVHSRSSRRRCRDRRTEKLYQVI